MVKFWKIFYILLFVANLLYWISNDEVKRPNGELIQEHIVYRPLEPVASEEKDFIIIRKGLYEISGRVLSVNQFYFDDLSEISPTDVILGWSKMSDNQFLNDLDLRQWGREHFIKIAGSSKQLTSMNIRMNSSRNHLVILDKQTKKEARDLMVGELITIKGYLVDIQSKSKKRSWKTSEELSDFGENSGEIILVDLIEKMNP